LKRIRWSPAAASDLESIRNYLREHHLSLMQPTIRSLYHAARSLKTSSHRGRAGKKEGTRELVMAPMPYIIVYGVEFETVHIFRVIHTSQDWPKTTR
jgi:addiction module RelE/StbE family toxin